MTIHPQRRASHPGLSAFVAANAGSGKTKTLVERVARLLLHGAKPETILCVTYTKAAAAEMQRRLYQQLGDWSVLEDEDLELRLLELGETIGDLAAARRLFAQALETPGGLKIQTLHAFCEKLLRRFPLEAGVSPGFKVMEDLTASDVSAAARDGLATYVSRRPQGPVAEAYAAFAVELDLDTFEGLLRTFQVEMEAIRGYLTRCGGLEGVAADLRRVCGLDCDLRDADDIEADAIAACDWSSWRTVSAQLLSSPKKSDISLGESMAALAQTGGGGGFASVWRLFSTDKGVPRARLGTADLASAALVFLKTEQDRLLEAVKKANAARIASGTVRALRLAEAYAAFYDSEKARRGVLDFPDLIKRTRDLLTIQADAAWVLFKLDGGVDHILLDEAQDTSPDQWAILEALTSEFFSGAGSRPSPLVRTLFAVGDEKQSIFSFQGADPEQLAIQTHAYTRRANEAGRDFAVVPLLESWRSAPEILRFVDQVFADPGTRAAVRPSPGKDRVLHQALRAPGAGTVDLWPLFRDAPRDPPDAWDAPLDETPPETAQKRLARRIAEEVRQIVTSHSVVAKGSPARPERRAATPGDVLILVRRRDGLFEELIRALKRAGLPVAGADRLRLSDHIVYQDLVSLFRFCLFPDDDLTLAELLRSPFCDVDEQGLFDLAYERQGSLWSALRGRSFERPPWRAAAEFLSWARQAASARAPFDFFGRIMSQLDHEGRSVRQRILTRLGHEAEDALDALSTQILAAEGRGVRDLEQLTASLERSEIEVKRELESEYGGDIRVMTVHGAKGLEAPIVILPDTTGKPPPPRVVLMPTAAGGFLFSPRKAFDCEASAAARAQAEARTSEEQLRLLYVGLTRARDRLIIAGRLSAREKEPMPGSWYALAQTAFDQDDGPVGARSIETPSETYRRLGADPQPWSFVAPAIAQTDDHPLWLRSFAAREKAADPTSPTAFAARRRPRGPSPLETNGGLGRFRRGDLIHKLLQLLPDLPADAREAAAWRLLNKERDLKDEQRLEIIGSALGVLSDERFADVFGPGSRAEATVAGFAAGLPKNLAISGRVDRMAVTSTRVLVVDYKSNRPSPETVEAADPAYLVQMAVYVAMLRAIFPKKRIEAALIWTDGPKLMAIPDKLIGDVLASLAETD